MSLAGLTIVAVLFACFSPALLDAQAQLPADPNTLSLSDSEKADLLSHDTEASVDAARSGSDGSSSPSRAIHGEIGAVIGSHGTRAAYGAAAIPLGDNSRATVSFESSHTDLPRWSDQRR